MLAHPHPWLAAAAGRRAFPIVILEVDLYRSLVLDTFVTTACLPHYVPRDNGTGAALGGGGEGADDGYKINVAAGWGSIDSRCTAIFILSNQLQCQ